MSSRIKILNSELTELATLSVVNSATRTEKINSDNILNFAVRVKNPASALINDANVISIDSDYYDIASYKKEQQSDGKLLVSVECEHISYRLNDYFVEYFTEQGTPSYILGKILEGTGFTAGTVEYTDTITFSIQEATSRRGVLMQFVATLGGEVQFNGYTVSILQHRGSATPKALTVGKDVAVISKTVSKRERDALGNPIVSYSCGLYKPLPLALGDVVTLDYDTLGIDAQLRIVSISYDPYNPNNVSIEVGNYANGLEDDLYRIATQSVRKDALMNGTRIGPEYGFEAVRNDKRARAYFKSDGMAFQAGDGLGNWTDKLYYDYDSDTGEARLIFDGILSAEAIEAIKANIDVVISNTIITNVLSANKGNIAELTVDQLDTSDKVQNYLNSDTSDVNYIKAYDQYIQWITASTDGAETEQVTSRQGTLMYWLDDTFTGMTDDETDYPVLQYVYTELTKAEISFESDGTNYNPVIKMGAGSGTGDRDKLIVKKEDDKATILYTTETGAEITLSLSPDGIICAGNTGAQGIRNIAVSATEPTTPQLNDLWIDTEA